MENTLDHVSVEQREKDRRRLLIVFTSKKKEPTWSTLHFLNCLRITAQRCDTPAEHHRSHQACPGTSGTSLRPHQRSPCEFAVQT